MTNEKLDVGTGEVNPARRSAAPRHGPTAELFTLRRRDAGAVVALRYD